MEERGEALVAYEVFPYPIHNLSLATLGGDSV